jgi:tellurite resistance protein TerC
MLLGVLTVLLLVDIVFVHRRAHVIHVREALIESIVWISCGIAFGVVIWLEFGHVAFGQYMGGYLLEKSLSVDNVFVWAVIFAHFKVQREFQHRVLFWGIFGALAMRLLFIFAGLALLDAFKSAVIVFGLFLLYSGVQMLRTHDKEFDPTKSRALAMVRRVIPSTTEAHGSRFFVVENGRRVATQVFLVLILVELTDVVFAVDSVPAVLAVTHSHYIAFASNAFAILGLRALYFLLAEMRDRFTYLQTGLGVILAVVGVKMVVSYWYHIPIALSLGLVFGILAVSIVASVRADHA